MLAGERQSLGVPMRPTVDQTRRVCPVCKAPCSVPSLVPIYVRNLEETVDEKRENVFGEPQNEPETTEMVQVAPTTTTTEAPDSPTTTTGLRQRLRFRSQDSDIPNLPSNDDDNDDDTVPARPSPMRPPRRPSSPALTPQRATTTTRTPLSPPVSLSQGLALHLQQQLAAIDDSSSSARAIPPLHRREGHGNAALQSLQSADPDAAEFLSRLLLLLGSFVILCLLLF